MVHPDQEIRAHQVDLPLHEGRYTWSGKDEVIDDIGMVAAPTPIKPQT